MSKRGYFRRVLGQNVYSQGSNYRPPEGPNPAAPEGAAVDYNDAGERTSFYDNGSVRVPNSIPRGLGGGRSY